MEEYPSLVEGTGLENREVVQAAQGFESLFLRHVFIISRDGAVWQLVGLITRRSEVQILLPQPIFNNMVSWCSWLTRLPVTQKIAGSSPVETAIIFGFIAQSVEQGTENPCVAGSIPAGATSFFYTWLITSHSLVAQLDRVFGYEPKGQGFESLRAHH